MNARSNGTIPKLLLVLFATALFTSTHLPIHRLVPSVGQLDKVAHFCTFAVLAFLLACVMHQHAGRHSILTRSLCCFGIVVIYGIVDELSQSLVSMRTSDPYDVLADVSGATVGLLIYAVLALYHEPSKLSFGLVSRKK